jgi:hypothetical protein
MERAAQGDVLRIFTFVQSCENASRNPEKRIVDLFRKKKEFYPGINCGQL